MTIKGLVFDKDGTLFDFAATWEGWAEAFLLGASKGDRYHATIAGQRVGFDLPNRRFEVDSIVIAGTMDEIADALHPHYPDHTREGFTRFMGEQAAQAAQVETVPLGALLGELKARGIALGVATNDSIDPAMAHLSAAGVAELFDFIAGCDSGYGGKPAPGQLHAFCGETGLEPKDCAMVGDSTHDLEAGRAAGMLSVGVLTGIAGQGDLAPFADVVLSDIGKLPAWLDSLA